MYGDIEKNNEKKLLPDFFSYLREHSQQSNCEL